MATQYLLATVTITQNVATVLSATDNHVNAFIVQAHPDNTSTVWIGDSTVDASDKEGIRLEIPVAGAALPYFSVGSPMAPNAFNLNDVYVDSEGTGQKVNVFYVTL